MKHNLSLRAILISFFSVLIVSSCKKADFIETKHTCTNTFTGEVTSCGTSRTVVYRFISGTNENKVAIQGNLTDFIGGDAVVNVMGASFTVTQSGSMVSSGRIIKLEGAVGACEEIIITIKWTSTNNDNTVSGEWSVKDAGGTDLALPVASLECESRRSGN